MEIEQIPEEVNKIVSEAVTNEASKDYAESEKERLKLEQARIKSEERVAERMAERDEKVAEIQAGQSFWETKFNELSAKIDGLFLHVQPQVAIDASHEASEIPVAAEDVPAKENEVEEIPEETVEELGGDIKEAKNKTEEIVQEPVKEIENETRKRGRKKRGRR